MNDFAPPRLILQPKFRSEASHNVVAPFSAGLAARMASSVRFCGTDLAPREAALQRFTASNHVARTYWKYINISSFSGIMRRRETPQKRILIPANGGSNPPAPATSKPPERGGGTNKLADCYLLLIKGLAKRASREAACQ
jgi:hypothetical protein